MQLWLENFSQQMLTLWPINDRITPQTSQSEIVLLSAKKHNYKCHNVASTVKDHNYSTNNSQRREKITLNYILVLIIIQTVLPHLHNIFSSILTTSTSSGFCHFRKALCGFINWINIDLEYWFIKFISYSVRHAYTQKIFLFHTPRVQVKPFSSLFFAALK